MRHLLTQGFAVDIDKPLREVGINELSIERLTAAMLFPENTNTKHLQLLYLRESSSLLPPLADSHLKNISSFANEIMEAKNNGVLAGFCLLCFHALHTTKFKTAAKNDAEASKRVVFNICKEYNLGRKERVGNKEKIYPTITTQLTADIWGRYQRVSHLWAAYIHLKGAPTETLSYAHPLEDVEISLILLLARQYERFMVNFFNGASSGHTNRESIAPFKVRYHDWSNDDPLKINIEHLDFITDIVSKSTATYVPDN